MMKNKKISVNGQALLKTILAAIGVAAIVFLSMLSCETGNAMATGTHTTETKVDSLRIYKDSINILTDSLECVKAELIGEVDRYILKASKRSRMTGRNIVEQCLEAEFDIPLLMAQAHLETHFAAYGGRNNVFGIYRKSYSHPDHAVSDYISLMQRHYIINRTPEELIASNFSMERNRKAKYAGNSDYGRHIGKIRNGIIKHTEITNLTKRWFKLKIKLERMLRKTDTEPVWDRVMTDTTRILC